MFGNRCTIKEITLKTHEVQQTNGTYVDLGGFYGLMGFSVALGLISLGSVLSMRIHAHDLIAMGMTC